MYSELEVRGGSDPASGCDTMAILDDVMITSLFSVHVMSAAGTLPPWIQNSWSRFPSFTVALFGLRTKESRMSGKGEEKRERERGEREREKEEK